MREFHISTPSQKILPQLQYCVDNLTKPRGSLGRIEEVAIRLGLIQQSLTPTLRNPYNIVFAADHGIASEGVSYSTPEVTRQMVSNFLRGGAAICMLCRQHGFRLRVVDCGVNGDFGVETNIVDRKIRKGTRNFLYEAAMTEEEFDRAVEIGVEMVDEASAEGCNVISFGEMGVANTSPSSVWMHLFTGIPLERCVGAGSGLNADGIAHKLSVLKQALDNFFQSHKTSATATQTATPLATPTGTPYSFEGKSRGDQNVAYLTSPKNMTLSDFHEKTSETRVNIGETEGLGGNFEVICEALRYFGGFEMVAAMGAMMRAAELGMTILVDGFIMTAVVLATKQFYPEVQEYCIFGHSGDEVGHRLLLDFLRAEPLLALGMRLGEGTGAVAAYPILETAVRMLHEMTTWDEAGVTKYINR